MTDRADANGQLVVAGYRLALDRAYQPETHVWVQEVGTGRVRLGLDPLGVETSGTIAQVALVPAGTELGRGQALGTIEAEKFVGPVDTPVSGTVVARNEAAVADPALLHRDPLEEGWLVELEPSDLEAEWGGLVEGAGAVRSWFEAKVADYRLRGVLAE